MKVNMISTAWQLKEELPFYVLSKFYHSIDHESLWDNCPQKSPEEINLHF